MGHTTIEWTEQSWNPVRGCRRVSPGCAHCYAELLAMRMSGPGGAYEGLVTLGKQGPRWTGAARFADLNTLMIPIRRKAPTMFFVNSMSDLFFEEFTDQQIADVFAVMAYCQRHTFQVLTKRTARARAWFSKPNDNGGAATWAAEWTSRSQGVNWGGSHAGWPLPNVWLVASVEDQERAEERLDDLLRCPAAVRGASYEPAIGPVDFTRWLEGAGAVYGQVSAFGGGTYRQRRGLDWVICGGESGPGARPMHPDWARAARDACHRAGVPFFFKQWGKWAPVGWCHHDSPAAGNILVQRDSRILQQHPRHDPTAAPTHIMEMEPAGKKAAGHLLDGVKHSEFPAVPAVGPAAQALPADAAPRAPAGTMEGQ